MTAATAVEQRRTVAQQLFLSERLQAVRQWVCWRYEERDGKATKVPVNPRTGGNASSTNSTTWGSIDDALGFYEQNPARVSGIGYVLAPGDDVIGVDLDHCITAAGTLEPWAAAIVAKLDSYAEVSPSGAGLRIFLRGQLPEGGRKRGNIEMYDRGRFLTVTGNHVKDTPLEVNERQAAIDALHAEVFADRKPAPAQTATPQPVNLADGDLLAKARAASNGRLFSDLWDGKASDYPSTSEADLALCNLLAFWTGNDAARIDSLFRLSGLYRSKWDERHGNDGRTYGQMTIDKATDRTEVYTPPPTPPQPPAKQILTLLQRLEGMQNGDRPAGLRALGDALAVLDAAAWATVRPGLLERAGLRAVDLDALRSDGQRRIEDQRRATITQQAAEAGESDAGAGYRVKYGVAGTPFLYLRKFTDKGVEDTLLAHFVPRIIAERVRHKANGETVRVFSCQLETARGARVFDALPEELGDPRRFYTACLNAAGADAISKRSERPIRDAAMELADPERERSEIFEFVGWYDHGGQLVYLSAAGAIGTEDVLTVDLSGLAMGTGFATLANYGPRDDGDEALQTALEALAGPVRDCLGDRVMLPQLAAVALAPALRWAPIAELPVLHTMGATGKGKTRSARIVQAFYGLDKPAASWGWTQTAIEIVASSLRDCVVCIDDLKSSTCDPRVAVKTMQRWADRRPRVRSNRSGSGLIGSPQIASLMLSNGEDLPSGEASVAARALFIPVQNEDFNEPAFRAAEGMLAALPTLTARYIAWLIEHQDSMNATAGASFREARLRYHAHLAGKTRINDAGRVASSCALLETGATLLAAWLRTVGWSEDKAGAWVEATRVALEDLATVQAGMIDEESAAVLFLSSIAALLDTHEAELVPVEHGKSCPPMAGCSPDRPGARLIGYRREDEILLDPGLALPAVRQWIARQGVSRPFEVNGLYAQLRSGGYLSRWDGNRAPVNHKLTTGSQKRLLVLKETAIDDHDAEDAEGHVIEPPGF